MLHLVFFQLSAVLFFRFKLLYRVHFVISLFVSLFFVSYLLCLPEGVTTQAYFHAFVDFEKAAKTHANYVFQSILDSFDGGVT